jgi:hypothetical protein
MSINNISGSGAGTDIGQLAQRLLAASDADHDGKLSTAEAGSFLSQLIESLSHTTLPTVRSQVGSATGGSAETAPTPHEHLASILGFSTEKLNDWTHVNDKYTLAVRHFAAAKEGKPPTTASLEAIAADARAGNFPNAKVTGDDTIDYGDGYGEIDVITSVGTAGAGWAFQNTTGNAQWEAKNHA